MKNHFVFSAAKLAEARLEITGFGKMVRGRGGMRGIANRNNNSNRGGLSGLSKFENLHLNIIDFSEQVIYIITNKEISHLHIRAMDYV